MLPQSPLLTNCRISDGKTCPNNIKSASHNDYPNIVAFIFGYTLVKSPPAVNLCYAIFQNLMLYNKECKDHMTIIKTCSNEDDQCLVNINIYISFCIVYTCKVLGLLIIEYYNDYIDAITCLYYGIYCLK